MLDTRGYAIGFTVSEGIQLKYNGRTLFAEKAGEIFVYGERFGESCKEGE